MVIRCGVFVRSVLTNRYHFVNSGIQQFFQVYIISSSTVRTIAVSFVYDKGWTIQLFMSCEQQNIRIGFLLLSRLNHAISKYKGLNYMKKSSYIITCQ